MCLLKKIVVGASFFWFLVTIWPGNIHAVTITIKDFPATVGSDQFFVDFDIEGPKPGINYFRIDLYKDDSKNSFGETYNGISWYGGGEGNQYFPITIGKEGTASGQLSGRVGNPSEKEYPGPGSYKLRLRRYTQSGSLASKDNQEPVNVQIAVVFPSFTPSPTIKPTEEPVYLTPTPYNPPAVKTSATTLKTPLVKSLSTTEAPFLIGKEEEDPSTPKVLSASKIGELTPSPTPRANKKRGSIIAGALISLGLLSFVVGIYPLANTFIKKQSP